MNSQGFKQQCIEEFQFNEQLADFEYFRKKLMKAITIPSISLSQSLSHVLRPGLGTAGVVNCLASSNQPGPLPGSSIRSG